MTESRRKKLNKIGFCWDIHEASWQTHFESLKKFKEANGHVKVKYCRTGLTHDSHNPLCNWIASQRVECKKYFRENRGSFVKHNHRIKLLENIGIDLDP